METNKIFLQKNNVRNLTRTHENFRNVPKSKMTSTYIEVRLQVLDQLWASVVLTHNFIVENLDAKWKEDAAYMYGKAEEEFIDCKKEMEQMAVNAISLTLENEQQETSKGFQTEGYVERNSEYYDTLFKRVLMSSKQRTKPEDTFIIEKTKESQSSCLLSEAAVAAEQRESIMMPVSFQGLQNAHLDRSLTIGSHCKMPTVSLPTMQKLEIKMNTGSVTKKSEYRLVFKTQSYVLTRGIKQKLYLALVFWDQSPKERIDYQTVRNSGVCWSDPVVLFAWLYRHPKRWKTI